jgi:DNA-directed RNA polymerase specialized sigma24 family protein
MWSRTASMPTVVLAAPLRAFLASRVPHGVDPDDALDELFSRIRDGRPHLSETERLGTWLYRLTASVLADAQVPPSLFANR